MNKFPGFFVFLNSVKPSMSILTISDKRTQAETQSFSNSPKATHRLNEGIMSQILARCAVTAPSCRRDGEGPNLPEAHGYLVPEVGSQE